MSHIRQIFVPQLPEDTKAPLTPGPEHLHYLKNVLRLQDGAAVIVICQSSGRAYQCIFRAQPPQLLITAPLPDTSAEPCAVHTLIFSLCKGKKNELVIEKATELGVSQIILFESKRSILRLRSDADIHKKIERWNKIAEGAASQSRQFATPHLVVAQSPREVLQHCLPQAKSTNILLSLEEEALPLKKVCRPATPTHLIVGPEGDLTPEETQAFVSAGFIPATLGGRVLRAETAAIAGIAMVHALSR